MSRGNLRWRHRAAAWEGKRLFVGTRNAVIAFLGSRNLDVYFAECHVLREQRVLRTLHGYHRVGLSIVPVDVNGCTSIPLNHRYPAGSSAHAFSPFRPHDGLPPPNIVSGGSSRYVCGMAAVEQGVAAPNTEDEMQALFVPATSRFCGRSFRAVTIH